jgi:perosamine synthetase
MHTFGHPSQIVELKEIAEEFNLVLIEDAAESLGSSYNCQQTGTFGELGILSFNGNKTITTGGGGAILTNDVELGARAKHLTSTAKAPHPWEFNHTEVAYNYRMPNLNAALGCAQLEQLPKFLAAKRNLFFKYERAFREVENVQLVHEPAGCQSNYWLQALVLDESIAGMRDQVLQSTNDAGYMTRPAWTLMHKLDHFADCPRSPLPVAESLSQRLINIPSSASLGNV